MGESQVLSSLPRRRSYGSPLANERLLNRAIHSIPTNRPITTNLLKMGRFPVIAQSTYIFTGNKNNMADFKVAFSKVCETFGLKNLREYQKQSIINIVEKKSNVFC